MNKRFDLKYGDHVLAVITVDGNKVAFRAMERESTHQLDSEALDSLARSLISAGTTLLGASAMMRQARMAESRVAPPKSLADLEAQVKEIPLSGASGRFAKTMIGGLMNYVRDHFAERGIDVDAAFKNMETEQNVKTEGGREI